MLDVTSLQDSRALQLQEALSLSNVGQESLLQQSERPDLHLGNQANQKGWPRSAQLTARLTF